MAQETQLLKLDLDTKEFIAKLDAAEAKLGDMGDPSTMTGLLESLKGMGAALGVIGVAALGAKAALDLTLQAESVKAVNQQFEILTRNAGVSGEKLKASLLGIADGLVDDTDLLKSAGQAVVQLGTNAEKLPEIFQLARQVTTAFGGDLLENFEKINQAISSGNTRALKSYGLTVDQDKVLREYARSIGVTVDALSEQERKSAILNATLEKGKVAFKGVSDQVLEGTNTWKQFQVTLGQIGETAALAFEKLAGKQVRTTLRNITDDLKLFSAFLSEKLGDGADAAAAKQDRLQLSLKAVEKSIAGAENNVRIYSEAMAKGTTIVQTEFEAATRQLGRLNEEKARIMAELGEAQAKAAESTPEADPGKAAERDQEAASRRLAVASKFESDLGNLRLARIGQELEVATSIEEVDRLQAERKQTILDMLLSKEEQVRAQVMEGKQTEANAEQQLIEYRKAAIADMRRVEQKAEEERLRALQNLAQQTQFTAAGFANGFKAASTSAARDVGNFSKLGATAFNSFSSNAKTAFMDLGKGTKSAADIMKGFFLNALADIAESQGAIMIANIYNPASVAAGAGLLVLAGFLRSLASEAGGGSKGGIGASASTAGGGGGGGGAGSMSSAMDVSRPELEESRRRRDVQLVI